MNMIAYDLSRSLSAQESKHAEKGPEANPLDMRNEQQLSSSLGLILGFRKLHTHGDACAKCATIRTVLIYVPSLLQ